MAVSIPWTQMDWAYTVVRVLENEIDFRKHENQRQNSVE
jgi:hypothetical protein